MSKMTCAQTHIYMHIQNAVLKFIVPDCVSLNSLARQLLLVNGSNNTRIMTGNNVFIGNTKKRWYTLKLVMLAGSIINILNRFLKKL